MIHTRSTFSGFTLIELLIVLAIFSSILGMLFSMLDQNQQTSAIARDESEAHQNLQDALSLMTSELRFMGFPPQSYYEFNYLQDPGSPKNLVAAGLMEAGLHSIKYQGDINRDSQVDFVHYFLSGGAVPYSLNRFAGTVQSDGSLPGGSPQKLSEQVEMLEFRYYDRTGNETANVADIVTIQIHLTLRTKKVDPQNGLYRTVSETTKIRPLNL